MNLNSLTYFKAVILIIIKNTVKAAVNSDVIRAEVFISGANRICRLITVCRADNGEIGHSSCNRKVNNSVVSRTRLTERGAGMRSYNFSVDILIADIGVQLICRTKRSKHGEGRGKGNEPRSCHTCRYADHILLCDTDIENSVGARICEVLKLCGGCKVSCDRNYFFMLLGKVRQGFSVNLRGGKLGSLNYVIYKSACHYSNSFPQRAIRSALYSSRSFAATFAISSSMAP